MRKSVQTAIASPKYKRMVKLIISTPTLGVIRYEWASHRYGQVIPVNWELSEFNTFGYRVDDSYNIISDRVVNSNAEWLIIVEDDVLVPQDLFIKIRGYIEKGTIPIVSGLYYTKSNPTEPLIFRGRGNGSFKKWKLGDRVWVDGIPMGCLLLHTSILKQLHKTSPKYVMDGREIPKIFETPRQKFFDPESNVYRTQVGTQDLYWCDRIIKEKTLEKAGWKSIGKREYPFLVDTTIFCKHIDLNTGSKYPDVTLS